jgi:hypothetical protein
MAEGKSESRIASGCFRTEGRATWSNNCGQESLIARPLDRNALPKNRTILANDSGADRSTFPIRLPPD